MAYITAAALKDTLAAHLKLPAAANLPAQVDVYATNCVDDAYNLIRRKLLGRGYTLAQIDSWDERFAFNRNIALYKALCHVAESDDVDLWPEKFNWIDALDTIEIVCGGELQTPGGTTGQVTYGTIDTTGDRFTRDTRW